MEEQFKLLLYGGDLSTPGQIDLLEDVVLKNTDFVDTLTDALNEKVVGIRFRSVSVLLRIAKKDFIFSDTQVKKIIKFATIAKQQKNKLLLSQLLGIIDINSQEVELVSNLLANYIITSSNVVVKLYSIASLANIASKDVDRKKRIVAFIKDLEITQNQPQVKVACSKALNLLYEDTIYGKR